MILAPAKLRRLDTHGGFGQWLELAITENSKKDIGFPNSMVLANLLLGVLSTEPALSTEGKAVLFGLARGALAEFSRDINPALFFNKGDLS